MSSTNKTSLGLNMWEASDKPVRQDFVNDNTIIDEKISQLNSNLNNISGSLNSINSNLVLYENQELWKGLKITVWKTGNVCTCVLGGMLKEATTTGPQNTYLPLPTAYKPFKTISTIQVDQNGKRMVFNVNTTNLGLYYLLDNITTPTNMYGFITWACNPE